jgi:hypothetical protein
MRFQRAADLAEQQNVIAGLREEEAELRRLIDSVKQTE